MSGEADRIVTVIDWFEKVPAKAHNHGGHLVGYYVEAADWRQIRSELHQIVRRLRAPSSRPDVESPSVERGQS